MPANLGQTVAEQVAAALIERHGFTVVHMVQRKGAGLADGSELLAVDVVLQRLQRRHCLRATAGKSQPPAGHVEHLAQRMEFDDVVLSSFDLKSGGVLKAVERHRGIGHVVHQQDVVVAAKGDGVGQKLRRGHSGGGVVGIADGEQLGPLGDVGRDVRQAREPAVFGAKLDRMNLRSGQQSVHGIDGVARVGRDAEVALIQICPSEVSEALFASDDLTNLSRGVEFHAECALIKPGGRLKKRRPAPGAFVVAMRFGLGPGGFDQGVDDGLRSADIGVTDAKIDHIHAPGHGLALDAGHFGKKVRGNAVEAARRLRHSERLPSGPPESR